MLRGAIVGAGNVALNGHLPGWLGRLDVQIVAAADVRADGRPALLERLPGARWHDSLEAMLAVERLDFLDVCTPPAFHTAAIRTGLEAGLHVLCEKPLAIAAADIPSLAALSRQRGRTLATVHNWRHAPVLERVTELVGSGAIGQIRHCRWETLRKRPALTAQDSGNWRVDPAIAGGGILMDHGWHALYSISQWLPGEPFRVCGTLERRRHRDWPIEDTATVILDYPHARAEVFLTWAADERANRVFLDGTEGSIRVEGGDLEARNAENSRVLRESFGGSLAEGSHHAEWFAGVAEEFVSEIREPSRRGRSLAEAERCARWIRSAQESSPDFAQAAAQATEGR